MAAGGAIDRAVEAARQMLDGDGYDVDLERFVEGELRLRITARPEACAECLVPKGVLASILEAELPAELSGTKITLTYPAETH